MLSRERNASTTSRGGSAKSIAVLALLALVLVTIGGYALDVVWVDGMTLAEHHEKFGGQTAKSDPLRTIEGGIVFSVTLLLVGMLLGLRVLQRLAEFIGRSNHDQSQSETKSGPGRESHTNPLGPDESRVGLFNRLGSLVMQVGAFRRLRQDLAADPNVQRATASVSKGVTNAINAVTSRNHPLILIAIAVFFLGIWGSLAVDCFYRIGCWD